MAATKSIITAVILAAGQAKRMGQPKQLLLLGGKPLVRQVAEQACQAGVQEVVVVTGAYAPEVAAALADLPLRLIHNERWAEGQSTSVKAAVEMLSPTASAVLFLLADQPLVDAALINKLGAAYEATKASIIAPRFETRRGNPVLFDLAAWRPALLQLTGDEGARPLLRDNPAAIRYVELTDGRIFQDVDTPADYQKVQELFNK